MATQTRNRKEIDRGRKFQGKDQTIHRRKIIANQERQTKKETIDKNRGDLITVIY